MTIDKKNASDLSAAEFEELFFVHYEFLCQLVYNYVGDRDVSKDLVQDFFVYFWEKRDTLKYTVSFKSYASQAVKYIAYGHLKREKLLAEKIDSFSYEALSQTDQDFESLKRLDDIDRLIAESIRNLPEKRREIFLLSNQKNMSYAQIAELKNVSINTVKTHVKLAYAGLRNDLSNEKLFSLIFLLLLK
ncbi:MAG: sigma-70 family RNA polymerase sigma factor [Sphingobacterium sp.]|jgi:RNA polymerase sigma-70 factor (ECF subfamily)|nr:sigma-70 family RNA polymerase sigma factor [Sphingobacterium sp.]